MSQHQIVRCDGQDCSQVKNGNAEHWQTIAVLEENGVRAVTMGNLSLVPATAKLKDFCNSKCMWPYVEKFLARRPT